VRFDGETQRAVKDVLFRVVPEAWPGAVSDVLPLIHVNVRNHTPLPVGDSTPSLLPSPAQGEPDPAGVKGTGADPVSPTPINLSLPSPLRPSAPPAAGADAPGAQVSKDGQATEETAPATWGDLKREGALLGVWGWTDQPRTQPGGELPNV